MGKKSSSASSSSSSSSRTWRYVQPRYYVKRPKRLAFLILLCVSVTWIFYDRQSLIRDHQDEILRLQEEVANLHSALEAIHGRTKSSDESIPEEETETSIHTESTSANDDSISEQRRQKVKDAMLHAWTSYEKYAWGMDELKPISRIGVDSFGGLGATLVDSLDTLYIMGLHSEFQKATEWIEKSFSLTKNIDVSVFETTIRILGGLLSAYDLSGEEVFLEKSKELAERLLPAWDTPSGIPYNRINLEYGRPNNPKWTRGSSILADSGSEQLEFIALSQRTNDPKYQETAEKVIERFRNIFPADGLLPIYINPQTGNNPTGTVTFGAMGDSFYEYLLKAWIQGNKTEAVKYYREMWETSMEGLQSMIRRSSPSSFAYISEKLGSTVFDKMDELACFVPGMLALGASGYGPEEADRIMTLAEELAWTCYNFYQSTPTKLAGENYYFREGEDMAVGTSWNIQRPETIESLFYLWRLTGNNTYREWGWDIFEAFESNSRIASGYVGLKDVHTGAQDDMMQSFFLAETLKYLYLLFSPPSVISLDEWVFNTEAHPLRIRTRNDAHDDEQLMSLDQDDKFPSHLRGRKEGRLENK